MYEKMQTMCRVHNPKNQLLRTQIDSMVVSHSYIHHETGSTFTAFTERLILVSHEMQILI